MKSLKVAVATSLMALAGCGGDSGSGGGGGSVQIPQPNPTPTPAPSPAPLPVYPLSDIFQDWRTAGPGAELRVFGTANVGDASRVVTSSDATVSSGAIYAEIGYKSADNSASILYRGSTTSFSAQDVDSVGSWYKRYYRRKSAIDPSESFGFALYDGFKYLFMISQGISERVAPFKYTRRLVLGGARTLVSDMPKSGTAAYKSTFVSGLGELVFYEATVSVNYDTGLVEGRFMTTQGLPPRPDEIRATLVLTGRMVNGENQFVGTITSPDSAYYGQFIGELFGPKGAEVGALFSLGHPTNNKTVGWVQGLRQ